MIFTNKNLKARKGDPIICKNGHRVGHFLRDVLQDSKIETDDLEFNADLMHPAHGYQCRACGEPVATFQEKDRSFSVYRASGWLS